MEPRAYETKKDYITKILQDKILSGEYKPGVRLKTRQLAQEFGTSEIPVREAINQLASAGFVCITPHVGAVASPISAHDLEEIFQIHAELASLATRLAVPLLTEKDLAALAAIEDKLKKAVVQGEPADELNHLNRQFHTYLYWRSGNRRLAEMIENLWDHTGRYPPPLMSSDDSTFQSLRDHEAIIECLRRKDADQAAELTKKHKERSMLRMLESLRRMETSSS